jgi:hypothetical protein
MIDVMIYLRAECLLFQNATSSQPEFDQPEAGTERERRRRPRASHRRAASAMGLTFPSTTASAEYAT